MTAYATAENISAIHGDDLVARLTERDEEAGFDVDLGAALEQASDEIDSYVGRLYVTPLKAPLPAFIVRYAVDIAVYILSAPANLMTDEIKDRYEKCVSHLKTIAGDRAVLSGQTRISDVSEGDGEGAGDVLFESDPALFGRASTGGI